VWPRPVSQALRTASSQWRRSRACTSRAVKTPSSWSGSGSLLAPASTSPDNNPGWNPTSSRSPKSAPPRLSASSGRAADLTPGGALAGAGRVLARRGVVVHCPDQQQGRLALIGLAVEQLGQQLGHGHDGQVDLLDQIAVGLTPRQSGERQPRYRTVR